MLNLVLILLNVPFVFRAALLGDDLVRRVRIAVFCWASKFSLPFLLAQCQQSYCADLLTQILLYGIPVFYSFLMSENMVY